MVEETLNVFPCKRVGLKNYLMEKGLEYYYVGVDSNGITYWLFAKTPKFRQAMKEWKSYKETK